MRSTDEVYGSLAYDGAPLLHRCCAFPFALAGLYLLGMLPHCVEWSKLVLRTRLPTPAVDYLIGLLYQTLAVWTVEGCGLMSVRSLFVVAQR